MERSPAWEKLTARQRAFVSAYAIHGVVAKAAEIAGASRRAHYLWMQSADYQMAFADACDEVGDRVEAIAHERALYGWDEPVIHQGQLTLIQDERGVRALTIRKIDNRLLETVLKRHKQEYKESYKPSEDGGRRLPVPEDYDLGRLSEEQLRQYMALLRAARKPEAA